jgi:DNA-binding GntR family transcriptional regulator
MATIALSTLVDRHLASREALPDSIARTLREAIFGGAFAPNSRLHQDDLAKLFGVSRIPVREALMKLVVEGLAVQRPNRGIRVAPISAIDFQDITELRLLLEPQALRLSAPHLTEQDYSRAQSLLRDVHRAGVGAEAATLHWKFHQILYARADRPRLLAQIDSLHVAINRYVLPVWREVGLAAHWDESHVSIIDALRAQDVEAAIDLTSRQIEEAAARVLERIAAVSAFASDNR